MEKTADQLMIENLEKKIAQLAEANANLEAERDDAISANDALTKEVENLSTEIEKLSNLPADQIENKVEKAINLSDHTFEHEDITYGFNYAKQVYKGQVITPVEIKASKELQADLISRKSDMIYQKSK